MPLRPPTLDEIIDDTIRHGRRSPILLAEDDAEMRSLVATQLRADGYDLLEAQNGVELIRVIHRFENERRPLYLVITDVRMPGFDGLEVLEYLRCAGITVPVIVMTAFGDALTHARARSLDAALVLDKPFDVDDLRAAVAQLVPPAARAS